MKNLIILLFIVLLSYPVMAQEQTLISGEIESGGYGGPFLKIGQINGETGLFMGGQGGWIINHTFVLGGIGYGLVNEVEAGGSQNLKLEFGCGGGLLEFIIASNKIVHFSVQSMIGAGGVKFAAIDYKEEYEEIDYSDDGFFVLEPGANVIINVSNNFRIGLGVTYRYINGVDYADLSDSDLSGVSAQILLKFGDF